MLEGTVSGKGGQVESIRTAVAVLWLVFWVYWLVAARGMKPGSLGGSGMALRVLLAIATYAVIRASLVVLPRRPHPGLVTNVGVGVIGLAVLVAGLGLAVWARVHLGRNWGMPMSRKDEPELVTDGPYRLIRHPIYTGLVLAIIGSSLTVSLLGLVVALIAGGYFTYAATVEERNLVRAVPGYAAYRARTRKLIPYVL